MTINADTVGKAVAGATIAGQGNNLVLDTSSFYKPTQPGAYPIVLATYELVCSKYADQQIATAVRAFLQSTIGPGQADLEDYGYFPLPNHFQSQSAQRRRRHQLGSHASPYQRKRCTATAAPTTPQEPNPHDSSSYRRDRWQ